MAILNAEDEMDSGARTARPAPHRSGLFVRTLVGKGAVSRSISCSMIPPHAMARRTRGSPASLWSCRQVVVSRETSIEVLAVDDETLSLRPLVDLMLFARIFDIAAISSPVPGRDVLVVLSESSKVSFMQFDDHASRLRCSGEVSLVPVTSAPSESSLRSQARLLATHPRKRMVAVAGLQSVISVFPVLFLPKQVNAGKIANVTVDGVILSLDFLEDEEGVPGDAILLALLQRGKEQVIALYTVGVPPDSGGGLSVTFVGSMITCASHPDDVAVARATSKLTGETVRPTPPAVAVTRLAGCPFLFAVFVNGKVIAGDARSVIVNAHSGDSLPMSVRIEDNIVIANQGSSRIENFAMMQRRRTSDGIVVMGDGGRECFVDRKGQVVEVVNLQDAFNNAGDEPHGDQSSLNPGGTGAASASCGGFELDSGAQNHGRASASQGQDHPSEHCDGTVTVYGISDGPSASRGGFGLDPGAQHRSHDSPNQVPDQPPDFGDSNPMAYGMSEGHALRPDDEGVQNLQSNQNRRTTGPKAPFMVKTSDRNMGEDYLSYLFVPAYITLDVGDSNGVATAWVDARDHFRDEAGDGSGLYFVMESGAMFALKWSDRVQRGSSTFRIPGGERTRTAPKRNFSVEFIGDVGPAVAIASLDRRLLYIANDGADGSLRRLHLPSAGAAGESSYYDSESSAKRAANVDVRRYGLEVRQEFLNLSPISDFVIASPTCKQRSVLDMGRQNRLGARRGNQVKRLAGAVDRRHRHSAPDSLPFGEELQLTSVAGDHLLVASDRQEQVPQRKDLYKEFFTTDNVEQSGVEHALYGGDKEPEIIVCSGIGRHGSIRLVRPGAPVSIFASSANAFTACNDIWPIRFTRDSMYDAGLVLTFAESTGVLFSVPADREGQSEVQRRSSPIARLLDGTVASGLRSTSRSIAVGLLEDGVLAQVWEGGIRVIYLARSGDISGDPGIEGESVSESICEKFSDWTPPGGGFISVGTVGAGFVVVCVMRRGPEQPVLHLLSIHPSASRRDLCVVSCLTLKQELSCIAIPEWTVAESEFDVSSPRLPPMVILGTYAPSVEVRLLGPTMELLDRRETVPWSLLPIEEIVSESRTDSFEEQRQPNDGHRSSHCQYGKRRQGSLIPPPNSSGMTAVPESICGLEVDERRLVFAGLRDGSVLGFSFGELDGSRRTDATSPSAGGHLRLDSHRKLGHRPVVLKAVDVALGRVVIGQAERPWMCAGLGGGKVRWTPLAFSEARALCSFSVLGAERCFAVVAGDDALHICGLRRQSETSVRSIHVGVTPRRVLVVDSPKDSIVVATCRESGIADAALPKNHRNLKAQVSSKAVSSNVHSELRVYHRKSRLLLGSTSLLPGELVHVMLSWLGFVVVGTSFDIRSSQKGTSQSISERGRLLLFSLRSHSAGKANSSSRQERTKFALCSEIVFPGAVLAGAVHPEADIIVISCNEEVLVFGVSKLRNALVEIARTSARTVVVSISIYEDIICVADRKDSLGFFQLESNPSRLVRDRGDHRRRIVSDAAMFERTLAVAVDRFGCLFSLGYEEGDAPSRTRVVWPDGPIMSRFLRNQRHSETGDVAMGPGEVQAAGAVAVGGGLGEEFDEIEEVNQGSGSDHQNENNDHAPDSAESSMGEGGDTVDDMGGSDQGAANEGDEANGGSVAQDNNLSVGSDVVIGEVVSGVDDGNDEGTDVADGTLSTEEGLMTDGQEPVTVQAAEENVVISNPPLDVVDGQSRRDSAAVPRNLVCHHSFNMKDTALRVRVGTFCRSEKLEECEKAGCTDRGTVLVRRTPLSDTCSTPAVFCGTLGGAIVTAVPVSPSSFALLSEVERAMSLHPDIAGPALGRCHKRFRAAYDADASDTVDGDLLSHFDFLDYTSRMSIAHLAGCSGEEGVLRIEALIRSLSDQVS